MKTTTIWVVLALLATSLVGCGGDTYVQSPGSTTISKGQELTDLQRALNEGAISKAEYDRIYKKLLAR